MRKIIIRVSVAVVLSLSVIFLVALPMAINDGETPPPDTPAGAEMWNVVDVSKAEYSYSEMVDDLSELSEKSEGRLTYKAVGESLDGRRIYAAVLGNQNAEKQIVISAGIHAREYMTPMLVMKQIEYYLCNYETGEYEGVKYSEMFDEYAFCILPMCNPDGITLVQDGLEGLRSQELRDAVVATYESDRANIDDFSEISIEGYLEYWKANAKGVDLNRNFDTPAWYENRVKKPSFADFRGENPLSEPEARAMIKYVEGLSNPVCSLAIHSRGEIIYFDCAQENKTPALTLARLVAGINGYRVDYNTRSVAAFDDWCNIKKNIPSVTVETGISPCPLPIEEFEKIWNDNKELWAAVAVHGEY